MKKLKKVFNKRKTLLLTFFILITIITTLLYSKNLISKNLAITKDINYNEVPYISTYYIKPIVNPNEEVIINYYVTDFYQKEYRNEDTSESFTITVKIDGEKDIIKKNIKAGDNSISLGKFSDLGEKSFSILATDIYGRNSHELFNYFLISNDAIYKEYKMTIDDLQTYNIKNTDNYEEKIYVSVDELTDSTVNTKIEEVANSTSVTGNKYVCFIGKTSDNKVSRAWLNTIVKYSSDYNKDFVLKESTETRIGLQNLLIDKKNEGYNKVILLPGIYRIDHNEPIYIPNKFTLDLNGATIKQNQFTGDKSLMFSLDSTYDSHVINGTIEGDYYSHDYLNSPNNSEWVMGVSLSGESKFSSYEDLIIKDITGYGGGSGLSQKSGFTYFATPLSTSFSNGDINRNTGKFLECNNRLISEAIDISNYEAYGYLTISKYLGYQGISGDTWNLICHFYDENNNYLTSIDGYQYRKIKIPTGAKHLKISVLSNIEPTDLYISLFKIPSHCSFKNITFDNCRCIGLAQSAMNDMLVENCEFTRCGQSAARCAYDAEDGWDQMQDVTFRRLNFYNNYINDFLTCAGHNFTIENIISGKVHFWDRTNSYVVRNNNLSGAYLGRDSKNRTGYVRFYNNTVSNIKIAGTESSAWNINVNNCTINGKVESTSINDKYYKCSIEGSLTSYESIPNIIGGATFVNCNIFNRTTSHNLGGEYYNCTLENIAGTLQNTSNYYNCDFINFTVNPADNSTVSFYDCNVKNSNLTFIYWQHGASILVDNCTINNEDYFLKLPHYSLNQPIVFTNNTFNCNSEVGLIIFYDDRTNTKNPNTKNNYELKLENNTFNLLNSPTVINGLSSKPNNTISIYKNNNSFTPNLSLYIYD